MRVITKNINVYSFEDLETNQELKDRVLRNLHDLNTDSDWSDDDYYKGILKAINGRTFDKMYYDIDRGNYCSFEWSIDSSEFNDFMTNKEQLTNEYGCKKLAKLINDWTKDWNDINKWVKYCSDNGMCHAYAEISHGNNSENIDTSIDSGLITGGNLYNGFEQYEELLREVCSDLSNYFLGSLRSSYEYLTSEEAILESIEANGYEFTEDGQIFN